MGRGSSADDTSALRSYESLPENFDASGYRDTEEARSVLAETGLDRLDVGLLVVSGSHAYGLETPTSDRDYRGLIVAPIEELLYVSPQMSEEHPRFAEGWSLTPAQTEYERQDPDIVLYELSKFVYLAGRANPNVLELLYCPLLAESDVGRTLRANRNLFLSQRVRLTYLGYAVSQLRKTESIEERRPERRAKFARHLFRLLEQGEQILTEGTLSPRVADPERVREMSLLPIERIEAEFRRLEAHIGTVPSDLPLDANWDAINELLADLRLGRR